LSMNCMRPALSKSCITISSSLKSTTVIWQSSCKVGVCGRPPLSFEGSRPGSWPGCQFGRKGLASTVLKDCTVPARVRLRVKIGDGYSFGPSGSDRIDEGRCSCPVAAGDWPCKHSKLANRSNRFKGQRKKS
jgi:hypothetical protein